MVICDERVDESEGELRKVGRHTSSGRLDVAIVDKAERGSDRPTKISRWKRQVYLFDQLAMGR